MEHCRRANVDDVDIVHSQHFVKGPSAPWDREFVADRPQPALVDIAHCHDSKLVGMLAVTLSDVISADAAAGDGDCPDLVLRHACQEVADQIYKVKSLPR